MTSFIWHSNLNAIKVPLFFFLITVLGCDKEPVGTDYVARVNGSYLTREEFASLVDTSSASQARRNEIISRWIQSELLFQKAESDGLLKRDEYQLILKQSARELAGALLLEKLVSSEKIVPDISDIRLYYSNFANEFRLSTRGFIMNIADFIDEDKAIRFRNQAIEKGWNNAFNIFMGEQSIVNHKSNHLFRDYELSPASIERLVNQLYPNEISIVISTKPGYYTVVQLLARMESGSIPDFEYVKQDAEQRVIAIKRQSLVNSFIKDLYSKSRIEIKNQD
jgi:hypothetical protein